VLVEGGKRPRSDSEAEAIAKGAEAHLITYLATHEDIETFSPEPPEEMRFAELLKNFSKEEIAYYEFAKVVHQWNRHHGTKPNFEDYMKPYLDNDRRHSGWSDFDFSIAHMAEIENKIFNREFNKDDFKFYDTVINPTITFSRINEVSRVEDSGLRDKYILQQIEKFWQEGKNIFIVYGCSHAVMHEQAVRKLV
ncbi:hypothetical protein K8Q96_01690, partial [Candidatus Nomurabacteria bacterium]|nr:hypothetical protein [Candidatus Nomurabacteria bacterium]